MNEYILKTQVRFAVQQLTPRLQFVMNSLFGLDGPALNMAELGREMGINKERVRQLKLTAIRKLRHPSISKELRGLLEDAV